jgi:guanylate kinase
MSRGCIVIVSGPSGVGKDTVIAAWAERDPRVQRVVACTTRLPRPGEQQGVDYHFIDESLFLDKAARGEFIEYKLVHGNYYATPKSGLDELLSQGQIAVLKIDVQGALTVMESEPYVRSIFLLPPSWDVLEQRIRGRGTESEAVIQKRLEGARQEIALADRYQHRVVNDDLQMALDQLQEIVKDCSE